MPDIEGATPNVSRATEGKIAGTGSMKRFGAAGFLPKEEVLKAGFLPKEAIRDPQEEGKPKRQPLSPQARIDLFALIAMGAGIIILFIGLLVWFGWGPALTTLGLVVVVIGFWTSVDNHRPKNPLPNTLTNGK